MANDLNQCNFLGRAGKDSDLRFMPNGKPVATFSMAVGRSYKDGQGNKKDETTWINVVVFGPLAEHVVAKYVTKGKQLFVSGRLQIRKYQDREGVDKYSTEIIAENIQLLGGNVNQGAGQNSGHPQQQNNSQGGYGAGQNGGQQQGQTTGQSYGGAGQFSEPAFNPEDEIPFSYLPEFRELK